MWRSRRYLLCVTFLILIFPDKALGQTDQGQNEIGAPYFFEHFGPEDYQHYPQNWSIIQDRRGVIYAGNTDGVLEFDGVSWRCIVTPTTVRSLTLGQDGKVYVGISGDFGYLAPDSSGTFGYVSLSDEITVSDREFSDVWSTHATSEGVYFQATERLFRWNGRSMKVWKSQSAFHTSFVVHDRFYIREKNVGLFQITNDSLHMASDGAMFATRYTVMMAPYGEEDILIGTSNAGFFKYHDGQVTPFTTEADDILHQFALYHGCWLPGGFYALATLGSGSLIIDAHGRLVQILNKASGFPDDWVNHVYADAQGGVWMALDAMGIARVDVPSQLTVYDDQIGLDGNIDVIRRHQGALYLGTTTGLFKLKPAAPGETPATLSFLPVLTGKPTPALLPADSILFAATHTGLYAIRGKDTTMVHPGIYFALFESRRFPGRIWVGRKDGLAQLSYPEGTWRIQEVYGDKAHPGDEIRSIAEDKDGTLWLSAADGTVLQLHFPEEKGPPIPRRFTQADGLPPDRPHVISLDGEVVLVSKQGPYRYDADQTDGPRFYLDASRLTSEVTSTYPLLDFTQDSHGNFWSVYKDRIDIALPQADGTYLFKTPPTLRFAKPTTAHLVVEENDITWIGNGVSLIRYDPSIKKSYDAPIAALVRHIVATRTERVIYGGAPVEAEATFPVLPHEDSDLRFEVSATSYNRVGGNQYQFFLEGHDKTWSAWVSSTSLTYHGLAGGFYKFRVRARNAQGIVSPETVFSFRMLPPWYRTWWAYLLYLITGLAALAFSGHHYRIVQENKRAQEQARELERERSVNKRLQEANESLRQANKLKDEFLANTSHELRTPLTAILGFSAVLKDELPETLHELLDPIESNGQRLLNTLNSLLDFAQLRAGMMEVNLQPINPVEEVTETLRLLMPLARQRKLALEITAPSEPLMAILDRQYFERVLTNLIGNAIKFTDKGGVHVVVEQVDGRIYVHIRDTGIGIDENFLPYLFDAFKQESTGLARLHEGNGLGLAITAQLVELMRGRIEVQSKKGEGSVFTISFALHTLPATPHGPLRHTPQRRPGPTGMPA